MARELFSNGPDVVIRTTENGWLVYLLSPLWGDGKAETAWVFNKSNELAEFIEIQAAQYKTLKEQQRAQP